jgi:hypothetical protein
MVATLRFSKHYKKCTMIWVASQEVVLLAYFSHVICLVNVK